MQIEISGCSLHRYDLGLIGGALGYIRDDFNTSEIMEEAIVGAAKVGAVLGTFLGETLKRTWHWALQGDQYLQIGS